jgi:hypothetical protein
MKRRIPTPRSDIRLPDLDRRSVEWRVFDEFRQGLIAHFDDTPDILQMILIDRAAWIFLRMRMMDEWLLKSDGISDGSSHVYLAWSNALRRLLVSLGIKPAPPKKITYRAKQETPWEPGGPHDPYVPRDLFTGLEALDPSVKVTTVRAYNRKKAADPPMVRRA